MFYYYPHLCEQPFNMHHVCEHMLTSLIIKEFWMESVKIAVIKTLRYLKLIKTEQTSKLVKKKYFSNKKTTQLYLFYRSSECCKYRHFKNAAQNFGTTPEKINSNNMPFKPQWKARKSQVCEISSCSTVSCSQRLNQYNDWLLQHFQTYKMKHCNLNGELSVNQLHPYCDYCQK